RVRRGHRGGGEQPLRSEADLAGGESGCRALLPGPEDWALVRLEDRRGPVGPPAVHPDRAAGSPRHAAALTVARRRPPGEEGGVCSPQPPKKIIIFSGARLGARSV